MEKTSQDIIAKDVTRKPEYNFFRCEGTLLIVCGLSLFQKQWRWVIRWKDILQSFINAHIMSPEIIKIFI